MKECIEWFRPQDKLPKTNGELLLQIISVTGHPWNDVVKGKFFHDEVAAEGD